MLRTLGPALPLCGRHCLLQPAPIFFAPYCCSWPGPPSGAACTDLALCTFFALQLPGAPSLQRLVRSAAAAAASRRLSACADSSIQYANHRSCRLFVSLSVLDQPKSQLSWPGGATPPL